MKFFSTSLLILVLLNTWSCTEDKTEQQEDDELSIEREKDYKRKDVSPTDIIPLRRDNQFDMDKD